MKRAMLHRIQFSFAVPAGEPPAEFRIFAAGVTDTAHGPCLFDEISAALVMQAYAQHGADLFIDYEHKSLDPLAPPGAGKAAAWFRPDVRDGELWAADVAWTPSAAEELRRREWRYFSPAVLVEADSGRVAVLINLALTNMPATRQMVPLVASQRLSETSPMSLAAVAVLLGLANTATEAETVEATRRTLERAALASELETRLREATGAESAEAAFGMIAGLKESATQAAELSSRVAQLEADGERREKEALIASQPRKFSPALKAWAMTQSLAAVRGFVASAPEIAALAPPVEEAPVDPSGSKPWASLSPREKHELYLSNRPLYEVLRAART